MENDVLPTLLKALDRSQISLAALVGPTGSGKSGLALAVAEHLDIEIINCDSRQVYRDFPVITAQPEKEHLSVCPHHLYGFLDTSQQITAGGFRALALAKIAEVRARGKLPLLVGGTGLYLRVLLYGLPDIPPIPEEIKDRLQADLERYGSAYLYSVLYRYDAAYAQKVHPRNSRHITRALGVYLATGRTFSWWHKQHDGADPDGTLVAALNFDQKNKERALAGRIEKMLQHGALREAARAWAACPDDNAPGWSGIGCAELAAWLAGRINLGQALTAWLSNTRAYAKRQMTWFKREKNILWL